MDEVLIRFWDNLQARATGPLHLRLWIQPTMALLFGLRDGWRDAQAGAPPYFWSIFTEPASRRALLRQGWQSVSKVFLLALVLDVVFQILALGWVFPGEAVLVAFLLALVPYLLIRGPVNRLSRRHRGLHGQR